MSDHKWRKDADGAESCEREGCTVRRSGTLGCGMWQRKRGGRWRGEQREPLPPCAGKEAALRFVLCQRCGQTHAPEVKHVCTTPAPSPLEVVREALSLFARTRAGLHHDTVTSALLAAHSVFSTLEESIRADELAIAITRAEDDANNPLIPTSMRLRVRLSELRGRNEPLEAWEESIRKDERAMCARWIECFPPCEGECENGCTQAKAIRNRK